LVSTGDEAAVSIRAVAEAVGVTPPSIYLHFADRNELIFAVCEEQFRHFDQAMEQAVAGLTDPMGRLVARFHAYLDFGLSNPEQYRILMMSRPDCTPDRFADGRLIGILAFEHLLTDVQAAIDAGAILNPDPVLVAAGMWMNVHGVTSLLLAKPEFPWPPRDELVAHILSVYQAGLKSGAS
jgi:AcrR family transcriptional regulator